MGIELRQVMQNGRWKLMAYHCGDLYYVLPLDKTVSDDVLHLLEANLNNLLGDCFTDTILYGERYAERKSKERIENFMKQWRDTL